MYSQLKNRVLMNAEDNEGSRRRSSSSSGPGFTGDVFPSWHSCFEGQRLDDGLGVWSLWLEHFPSFHQSDKRKKFEIRSEEVEHKTEAWMRVWVLKSTCWS
ncbi:hypothetical protein DITRI_Ditri18aG0054400 [Diplodiscus trichospermus]